MSRRSSVQEKRPFAGEHRWTISVPPGTDVRVEDRITAQGQVFSVLEVTTVRLQGIPVEERCSCIRLGSADGSAGLVAYLQPNARVTLSTDGAERPVHLDDPALGEERTPDGAAVVQVLYDAPDALPLYTASAGVTVTISTLMVAPGLTLPAGHSLRVGGAASITTPWPATHVLLIAPRGQEG